MEWSLKLKRDSEAVRQQAVEQALQLEDELRSGAGRARHQQMMFARLEQACAAWLQESERSHKQVLEAQELHYEKRYVDAFCRTRRELVVHL